MQLFPESKEAITIKERETTPRKKRPTAGLSASQGSQGKSEAETSTTPAGRTLRKSPRKSSTKRSTEQKTETTTAGKKLH